jgi:hypothetical protein
LRYRCNGMLSRTSVFDSYPLMVDLTHRDLAGSLDL